MEKLKGNLYSYVKDDLPFVYNAKCCNCEKDKECIKLTLQNGEVFDYYCEPCANMFGNPDSHSLLDMAIVQTFIRDCNKLRISNEDILFFIKAQTPRPDFIKTLRSVGKALIKEVKFMKTLAKV